MVPCRRPAFSLAEAVVCILLVGGVFVATMRTVGGAAKAQRVRAATAQGTALGMELMTEILQCYYKEPVDTPVFGREAGESATVRTAWDDVDDYNGLLETALACKDGTAIPAVTGWKREVTIAYADPTNPANTSATDAGLKRITVTVTDPRGRQTRLTALRSSASGYDQVSTVSKTYVTRVGITLQLGADANATVTSGVNLLNEAK
jgi:MSHA pilin protein MshD